MIMDSEFDGKLIQLIGWSLLALLLTVVTLGIGLPWAICMIIRWETKHTSIEGKQLHFNGRGIQLLGNMLKWLFFTIITLGIYSFWLGIKMKQWTVKHTVFEI